MDRSLKLKCTDNNQNTFNKNIPYMNPSATDYQLKTFAIGLNSLTTNTLNKIDKVDVTDITDVTNGGE